MLATEMFKVYRSTSPPIFNESFRRHDICHNLQINSSFAVPNVKSVFHKSVSYLEPKIWDIVPLELQQLNSLNTFKMVLKWQPRNCVSRLCQQYVLNIGFISNTSETCFFNFYVIFNAFQLPYFLLQLLSFEFFSEKGAGLFVLKWLKNIFIIFVFNMYVTIKMYVTITWMY